MKKKTFNVVIEEHISQEFEVKAKNIEEAMEIAAKKYDKGEFVVDAFNAPECKLMMAYNDDEETEWEEF